jgi:hypothetical protein
MNIVFDNSVDTACYAIYTNYGSSRSSPKEASPYVEEERRGLENCGPFKTTMEREVSKYRDRKEVSSRKPKIAIKIMNIVLREHS